MACIIKKNNSPYYYVKWYENGSPVEQSTGSRNKDYAVMIRNDIENKLALKKYGLIPVSSNISVGEFYKEFVETKGRSVGERSIDRYIRSIKHFLNYYPDIKSMGGFTIRHINDYLNKRKAGGLNEGGLYNELKVLKLFFGFCEKLHNLPSPAKEIKNRKPPKKESNIYNQENIVKMLNIKDIRERAVVMLDLQSGMRKGEMASRKWKHIDFNNNTIKVLVEDDFMPKDKENRVIPLKKETKDILLKWKKESKYNKEEDYVFYGRNGKRISHFDRFMLNILLKAGIEGNCKRFRDTFASYSLACGIPITDVRDWLGHSTFDMTNKYSYALVETLGSQIKKLFERK